ncbi:hypothetical protein [Pseudomonas sp. 24 E 13]|nr:hypothetical protein [Pseudomonas sp. 24 E 13]
MGQGAGAAHALALAHRQRRRTLVQLIADLQLLGQARHAAVVLQTQQLPGQGNIAAYIEKLQQPAGLQHIAQMPAAQLGEIGLPVGAPQPIDVDPVEFELPDPVRRQHQCEHIEQGAFAAAAGPDNRQLLTRAQVQRRNYQAIALAADAPALVHRVQAQHHGSVDNGTRYNASPGSASPNRTQLARSLWKVS